jgi:trimethylamine-N-oxide reductase (cytochrome c)
MRPLLVILAAVALLAACAGRAPNASPAAGGASSDDAARLYRSKCSACHRAYEPASRTRAGWADVMARMAPRAHLRDEERAVVLGWLQAHAKDAGGEGER